MAAFGERGEVLAVVFAGAAELGSRLNIAEGEVSFCLMLVCSPPSFSEKLPRSNDLILLPRLSFLGLSDVVVGIGGAGWDGASPLDRISPLPFVLFSLPCSSKSERSTDGRLF